MDRPWFRCSVVFYYVFSSFALFHSFMCGVCTMYIYWWCESCSVLDAIEKKSPFLCRFHACVRNFVVLVLLCSYIVQLFRQWINELTRVNELINTKTVTTVAKEENIQKEKKNYVKMANFFPCSKTFKLLKIKWVCVARDRNEVI